MVLKKIVEPPIDIESQKLTIEEIRRTLDWLEKAYASVKNKTLTFMGGGLALLTFLYSGGNLFFPHEFYGRVFYVTGLILVLGALVMLFFSMLPRRWEFTIDRKDIQDMNFQDYEHYLQYVVSNYLTAYEQNLTTYNKNHKVLNLSFYPLVFGAIILVVLKIFGAT